MRILFSDNHRWAQFHFRGNVMEALMKRGNEIFAVAPESGYIGNDNTIPGVKVIDVKLDRTARGIGELLRYFFRMFRIAREIRPGLAIHYTAIPALFGSAAFVLAGCGKNAVLLPGISEVFLKKGLKGFLARTVLKIALSPVKKVMLLNTCDRDCILKHRLASPEKILLLRGGEGVDTGKYRPETNSGGKKFKFLMISRLLRTKGYNEFRNAAETIGREFPETEFILCGEPDEKHPGAVPEHEVRKDTERGILSWRGRVLDIPGVLAECNCFVLPTFYGEGMNRSLMEALSAGKPLIASDIKGCREMIEDGKNGFLCKPKDARSLADAMRKMLKLSDAERTAMSRRSREKALEEFDIHRISEQYFNMIDEVTHDGK